MLLHCACNAVPPASFDARGLQPAGLHAWQPIWIPHQTCHAIGCRGDEPRLVADFKGVLGLEDKAAAEVHMNLARRLLREKAEQRKGGGAEQRKVRDCQLML